MTRLKEDFARFRAEGEELAGDLSDFQQRAGAYAELYHHSKGNFVFPLIAAHGALWGARHMRRGLAVSRCLARTFGMTGKTYDRHMAQVIDFTNALKEINRQVLIMTYVAYQMTRFHARDPELETLIHPNLIVPLAACHHARRQHVTFTASEKRSLFKAAFLCEQDHVVGPAVELALQKFQWSVIRALSMRPPIGFSYFAPLQFLKFRDFSDRSERIERGLQAYDIGARCGFSFVEECLSRYNSNQCRSDPKQTTSLICA